MSCSIAAAIAAPILQAMGMVCTGCGYGVYWVWCVLGDEVLSQSLDRRALGESGGRPEGEGGGGGGGGVGEGKGNTCLAMADVCLHDKDRACHVTQWQPSLVSLRPTYPSQARPYLVPVSIA